MVVKLENKFMITSATEKKIRTYNTTIIQSYVESKCDSIDTI